MGNIIYESDQALLTFEKANGLLYLQWKLGSTLEEYQNVYTKAMEAAQKKNVVLFLSDIRKQGHIDMDYIHWLRSNIIKHIDGQIKTLEKVGLIVTNEMYHEIYANLVSKNIKHLPIEFKVFKSSEEAFQWLELSVN